MHKLKSQLWEAEHHFAWPNKKLVGEQEAAVWTAQTHPGAGVAESRDSNTHSRPSLNGFYISLNVGVSTKFSCFLLRQKSVLVKLWTWCVILYLFKKKRKMYLKLKSRYCAGFSLKLVHTLYIRDLLYITKISATVTVKPDTHLLL